MHMLYYMLCTCVVCVLYIIQYLGPRRSKSDRGLHAQLCPTYEIWSCIVICMYMYNVYASVCTVYFPYISYVGPCASLRRLIALTCLVWFPPGLSCVYPPVLSWNLVQTTPWLNMYNSWVITLLILNIWRLVLSGVQGNWITTLPAIRRNDFCIAQTWDLMSPVWIRSNSSYIESSIHARFGGPIWIKECVLQHVRNLYW
jgi:hypothetical protein